ncbi:MAG: GTP cyclohydrolase I, partial [Flavobacteriaceae bacterium]
LQVQERLTEQILDCINDTLQPEGVAVVIEASHMCMMMRGVQKQNSTTTTSGFRGSFKETDTRNEFLKLITSNLSSGSGKNLLNPIRRKIFFSNSQKKENWKNSAPKKISNTW